MPGDVVYTGGNSEGRTITLSGSAANVATVFGGAVNVTGATELFLGALRLGENVARRRAGR